MKMYRQAFLALGALLLTTTMARAADIGVTPTKLIVVDKLVAAGKAKAVFVAKDAGVTKGPGTDATDISAVLDVQYDNGADAAIAGTFTAPGGAEWLVNKTTVAKRVNKDAPTGGATKVTVIKPGKLVKLIGKSLGDTPLPILTQDGALSGTATTQYCVTNGGEENCFCSTFDTCVWKPIGDSGAKLICKGGMPDDTCGGSGPTVGLSHFWVYLDENFGGTLDPGPVTVQDQFIGPVEVDPTPAYLLAVPVDKNGEGIPNAVDHLSFHAFDDGLGGFGSVAGPATAVEVTDQFGTHVLPLGPAMVLAVPSEAFPGPTPVVPQLDHFVCYSVDPAVSANIAVSLTDQFQTASPNLDLITGFCAPADKNGEGILNATEHLVLYLHDLIGIAPGAVPIRNQFGNDTLSLLQPLALLVPATKLGWCGNDVLEGSEECDGAGGGCAVGETCNGLCQCVPTVPPGWTCDPQFYGTIDGCDCGCGVFDPDCADATAASCEFCDDPGSCSTSTCPSNIDPVDNSTCVAAVCGNDVIESGESCDGLAGGCAVGETCDGSCQCVPTVPPGWTCSPAYYDELADICDCGCGVADPDCADATVGSCDYCDDPGSCGTGPCPANIDPVDNSTCVATVPPEWTCNPSFYGTADGCDCGCGALDPDCADATVGSCQFCDDPGSCGTGPCPANIDPVDNTTCTP